MHVVVHLRGICAPHLERHDGEQEVERAGERDGGRKRGVREAGGGACVAEEGRQRGVRALRSDKQPVRGLEQLGTADSERLAHQYSRGCSHVVDNTQYPHRWHSNIQQGKQTGVKQRTP